MFAKQTQKFIALGFSSGILEHCPDNYPESLLDILITKLESISGLSDFKRVLSSLFYYKINGKYYYFQFVMQQELNQERGICHYLDDENQCQFYPQLSGNVEISELGLHHVGILLESQIDKLNLSDSISLWNIGIEDTKLVNNLKEIDDIENKFIDNLKSIKKATLAVGYWCLPEDLPQEFQLSTLQKQRLDPTILDKAKAIFEKSPHFLEKFCYFKIKEIINKLKNPKQNLPPKTSIIMTVLEQKREQYIISEAELRFDGAQVVTINNINVIQAHDILGVLMKSSWLQTQSDKTCIRLADQRLEDSLVVRYCIQNIKYGILSSDIRENRGKVELNFWEDLANNISARQAKDLTQIKVIEQKLKYNTTHGHPSIRLDEAIEKLALQTDEIQQTKYVTGILQNQAARHGTLLNLPTGYGKTFILLMAMAQHYRTSRQKKPYLILVPKRNVRDSWQRNIQLFRERSSEETFGEPFTDAICQNPEEMMYAIEEKKQIIVIMEDALLKQAQKMILGLKGAKFNMTPQEFSKTLKNNQLTNLSACVERLISISTKIFSQQYYVLGDESLWVQAIDEITAIQANAEISRRGRHEPEKFNKPNLIKELKKLRELQEAGIKQYEQFKMKFGGIVLDESHDILIVKAQNENKKTKRVSKDTISITNIILDMSKTYLDRARIGATDNPLVIASSATPWPNNLKELKLHFRFIHGRLLSEFSDLNDELFMQWNSFENYFKGQQAQLSEQTIDIKALARRAESIELHFHHFIQLLFNNAVQYQAPGGKETNNSSESILFVECNLMDTLHINKEPDKNFLEWLREFYSELLGFNKAKPKSNKGYYHGITSNLYERILDNLPPLSTSPKKIAFYVYGREDGATLGTKLVDYYIGTEELHHNFIGFYYGEDFVAENYGVNSIYEQITYCNDNNMNRNAFNNIFDFADFFHFAKNHFYVARDDFLGDRLLKKFKTQWQLIINVIRRIKDEQLEIAEEQIKSVNAKALKSIRGSLENYILTLKSNLPKDKAKTSIAPRHAKLIEFIEALLLLEKRSQNMIIAAFGDVLNDFGEYIPNKEIDALSAFQRHYTNIFEELKAERATWLSDAAETFIYFVCAYLYKIMRSNILMVGDAGTAGMRIDADILILLSGAWTEGRLTQIKSRVGRPKPETLKGKHCQILLPLTNTYHEYNILQYYIKKSFYNDLIISKAPFNIKELCLPLFLSNEFGLYYTRCAQKDSLINLKIHAMIRDRAEKEITPPYLSLSSYEKAINILSKGGKKRFNAFQTMLDGVDLNVSTEEVHLDDFIPSQRDPIIASQPANSPIALEPLLESSVDSLKKMSIPNKNVIRKKKQEEERPTSTPKLLPLGKEQLDSSLLVAIAECGPDDNIIILTFPTRCTNGDLSFQLIWEYLNSVIINLTQKLNESLKVFLLLGINGSEENAAELNALVGSLQTTIQQTDRLFTQFFPFIWQNQDRWKNIPPLGQMRNYGLMRAQILWQTLTASHPELINKISLISMDGDTYLSEIGLFNLLQKAIANEAFIATAGYEMTPSIQQITNPLEEDYPSDEKERETYSTILANRICQNIYAGMVDEAQQRYYGYFCEPFIFMSPAILAKRFFKPILNNKEDDSPYGFWDAEGRHLMRHIMSFMENEHPSVTFQVLGPSDNYQHRALLMNFDRFRITLPHPIKQRLSQAALCEVIRTLHSQPQHCIKPYFMGANIAIALQIRMDSVRASASYYYIKNFVLLLNLGPMRAHAFSRLLLNCYLNADYLQEQNYEKNLWQVEITQLRDFIKRNFLESDKEKFMTYAPLLAKWALRVSEQLCSWFDDHIEEERMFDEYPPITLPPSYPRQAEIEASQDEGLFQPALQTDEALIQKPISDFDDNQLQEKLLTYLSKTVRCTLVKSAKIGDNIPLSLRGKIYKAGWGRNNIFYTVLELGHSVEDNQLLEIADLNPYVISLQKAKDNRYYLQFNFILENTPISCYHIESHPDFTFEKLTAYFNDTPILIRENESLYKRAATEDIEPAAKRQQLQPYSEMARTPGLTFFGPETTMPQAEALENNPKRQKIQGQHFKPD